MDKENAATINGSDNIKWACVEAAKPNPEDIDHTITKRTITLTVCSTQTSGFTNTEMDSIPDKHCFALLAS